ncbi:MAG: DUF1902 domain-containing protein [Lachnospiraceae bacterium]|nr:DUF1902 domain-containing protein [Lachnospiraceae bacterium]
METIIHIRWDEEAKVWYAVNDYIPLALESESLEDLRRRVKEAIPELIEMNHLDAPKYIYFIMESREEVYV